MLNIKEDLIEWAENYLSATNKSPSVDRQYATFYIDVSGKHQVFYTLWRYRMNVPPSPYVKNPTYLGNLSTDFKEAVLKARQKLPNGYIELDRVGTKVRLADPEMIKFGKYRGAMLEDIFMQDPRYIMWLADNYTGNQKEFVAKLQSLKEVYFKNLTEKNKEESTSEYYGNIDEKAQLIVKVYRIKATNYDGEMVYQYYFVDRDGNKFYTYSIKNADTYKEGDILEVKGTIKQHREIVGIKYTYLNRLKVLRVIQEPEMLFKDGGQIGQSIDFSSDEYSTIIYHEKEGNWFFPKDGVYVWLYDDPKAGDKLRSDEYDYILFPPQPPMSVAFQKNYVPPLLRIWTKDYQKKTKGSDKLIGIVKAFYEESENKLYIDMMTTRKEWRRQGVNSYLVNFLRKYFKLDKDDVVFVDTTKEGEAFQKSGKYAEGGEVDNQIETIAKSVVADLGEEYSKNDYLGKCKEISEEIAKRLNQIDIEAIPMRIIDGEDKKYNSPVFNHAYTFLPNTNQIIDTQLWQVDGNPTNLKSRKVLFDYDEYNNLVELYEVEPISDWENKYAEGGEIGSKYVHKHIPNMTFEITDFTTKGVKGIQKHSKSLSKKERIEGKVVFYSKAELKDLWQLEDSYAEGGEVELLQVGQTLRLRRLPIYSHPGYIGSQKEVTKKVKEITDKDVKVNGSKIITRYFFTTTDGKSLTATFVDNDLSSVYNQNVRYESAE
jgi:hypothetical protein